jgi:hypothetical protein
MIPANPGDNSSKFRCGRSDPVGGCAECVTTQPRSTVQALRSLARRDPLADPPGEPNRTMPPGFSGQTAAKESNLQPSDQESERAASACSRPVVFFRNRLSDVRTVPLFSLASAGLAVRLAVSLLRNFRPCAFVRGLRNRFGDFNLRLRNAASFRHSTRRCRATP